MSGSQQDPAGRDAVVIAEFGDPRTVAAAFGPELAAVQARRVALGLLVARPSVWAPVLLAVGASLTRFTLAARAARRCLAIRATLT